MHGNRSCFACCTKPSLVTADENAPARALKVRASKAKKTGISEDFWSTSTRDRENGVLQSQRSISSISTSNPSIDHHGHTGGMSNPSEFVNHGLLLWNQTRQQWIGYNRLRDRSRVQRPRSCRNATYKSLLGTSNLFPQPIRLSEMVNFLVDVWEQEGLYD